MCVRARTQSIDFKVVLIFDWWLWDSTSFVGRFGRGILSELGRLLLFEYRFRLYLLPKKSLLFVAIILPLFAWLGVVIRQRGDKRKLFCAHSFLLCVLETLLSIGMVNYRRNWVQGLDIGACRQYRETRKQDDIANVGHRFKKEKESWIWLEYFWYRDYVDEPIF